MVVANDKPLENSFCLICFVNLPNIVFLPCQHGGICENCSNYITKKKNICFICREEIKIVLKVEKIENKNELKVMEYNYISN